MAIDNSMPCNSLHLPALNRIARYQEARNDLVDIGREADATRTLLHPGETVAFLPWGNDFYLTYLAPNLDIKTFNIGGDKNLGAAVKRSGPFHCCGFLSESKTGRFLQTMERKLRRYWKVAQLKP